MTIRSRVLPVAAAALILLPLASPAHHQLDEIYGRDSLVSLTGTVLAIDWVNPHPTFKLSVAEPSGSTVEWIVEIDPPHLLQRRGWNRGTIQAGETVTVEGFRALNGTPRTYAKSVTLGNGETLSASSDASWNWRRIDAVTAPAAE